MDARDVLLDLFGRVEEHIDGILDELDPAVLTRRPAPGTNPIGWLVWHIARVEDAQIAELLGEDQLWAHGPWAARCGLDPDPDNSGYGHGPADVEAVRPDGVDVLRDYARAVRARTDRLLATLTADDLERIVDESWEPPVTMGVRLISVADDQIQHSGAAMYVKGLLGRG